MYEPSIKVKLTTKPVTKPELVTTTSPPFVVVIEPLRTKLFPIKVMPAAPFVLSAPLRVAVPDELERIEAADKDSIVMLLALLTMMAPSRVDNPAFWSKSISPVPADKVKLPGPFNVFEKRIN